MTALHVVDPDPDDPYTSEPTHVRIYHEDTGDEYVWHLDGVDDEGRYTTEVRRYETHKQAIDSVPLFVADTTYDGVKWQWNTQRQDTFHIRKPAQWVSKAKHPPRPDEHA